MSDKMRLDLDWENLFPGTTVTIAPGASVTVRPLTLKQLASLSKMIKPVIGELGARGITIDTLDSADGLIAIVEILVSSFPNLVSDILQIHEDDLNRLPIGIVVELLVAAYKENVRSKEGLEKNLKSLAEAVKTALKQEATAPLETSSNS